MAFFSFDCVIIMLDLSFCPLLKKMCWIYLNLCQKPLVALPLTEERGSNLLAILGEALVYVR